VDEWAMKGLSGWEESGRRTREIGIRISGRVPPQVDQAISQNPTSRPMLWLIRTAYESPVTHPKELRLV